MDKFKLTNENISIAVETVQNFLGRYKVDSKDVIRTVFALEDTLLNYRDAFDENTECSLKIIHRLGRIRVELTVSGNSFDPFTADDDTDFSRLLLSGMGMAPVWRYKNGQNIIIFTPRKKKPSQMVYILAAVLLALIGGGLSSLLPQNARIFISEQVLTPVFDKFLGLLNGVAGIMIFLSVTWGICSVGDTTTLSTIGKKMIGRMLLMMTLIPTVYLLCILSLFDVSKGVEAGAVDFSGPFGMILGIIPSNMLAPFLEGNFLQIIFIAAMIGIALLVLGSKTTLVTSFLEQANAIVQLIMEVICSFIALIIFISLYNMILTGSFSVLLEIYKAPLLILGGCLFAICFYMFFVCIRKKVNPGLLISKIFPAFLIGLTTASSSAAMSTTMESCEKQLGIDRKLVDFGVPLGQIIFGTASVIEFLVLGLCMAEIYGTAITPMWIVLAIFTSVMLTVATPPIPGGSVALCTVLFSQLGIPLEGLAIAVAVDVVADFFITATEIFCLQSELVVLSGSLNMLDTGKLQSKMP
ncbi:MAG: cation:dicarboxylase symporter family transporter [Lachnospiraceae bacterium]|nr:cation:dicarboxylase symporter family transporter [Lachnospiraceae bacterium]